MLRVKLPALCSVVDYADDTLVLAAGSSGLEAAERATEAVARLSRRFATLGLKLAAQKTETLVFRFP